MVHCWDSVWAALPSQALPSPAMLHTPSVNVHVCVDGAWIGTSNLEL